MTIILSIALSILHKVITKLGCRGWSVRTAPFWRLCPRSSSALWISLELDVPAGEGKAAAG